MSRIIVMSGGHLCHNPRVQKEAVSLARRGFFVEVLGGWFDPVLRERDEMLQSMAPFRFTPVIDISRKGLRKSFARARGKLSQLGTRLSGIESRWQLNYCYPELRQAAFARSAELYIAHSEPAMAVAVDLLHAGRSVGLDLEDWFSEDLPIEARRGRPTCLLQRFEKELLTRGSFASCPSHAMSNALFAEYGGQRPLVVYNAFPWTDRNSIDGLFKDRAERDVPSVHWFSQTIGPDRGLEDLLSALPLLKCDVEIHLRGNPAPGFAVWLTDHIPKGWHDRMFIHGLVPNEQLLSRIAEHDIGFAGEMKYCRSRDLTVTNKILQYLLAGLAVVASDTAGQREVAGQAPEAVSLYPSGDASELAEHMNALLQNPERLCKAKAAALQAAEKVFRWERQEPVLVDAVTRALYGHV